MQGCFLDPASMLLFGQIILVNFGEVYWQMLAKKFHSIFFIFYRQFELVDYALTEQRQAGSWNDGLHKHMVSARNVT